MLCMVLLFVSVCEAHRARHVSLVIIAYFGLCGCVAVACTCISVCVCYNACTLTHIHIYIYIYIDM